MGSTTIFCFGLPQLNQFSKTFLDSCCSSINLIVGNISSMSSTIRVQQTSKNFNDVETIFQKYFIGIVHLLYFNFLSFDLNLIASIVIITNHRLDPIKTVFMF